MLPDGAAAAVTAGAGSTTSTEAGNAAELPSAGCATSASTGGGDWLHPANTTVKSSPVVTRSPWRIPIPWSLR